MSTMLNASRLNARSIGNGPPLVAVHGWGADSRILEPMARRLGSNRTVWLPDLPGHGRTPHSGSGQDFNDHCSALLAAWVEAQHLTDAPVMAWAWGARLVVDLVASARISPPSIALIALPPPADVPDPYSGPIWRDHARYMRAIVRLMTADPVSPESEEWLTSMMASSSIAATGGSHAQPWAPPSLAAPAGSIAILGRGDRIGRAVDAADLVRSWGIDAEVWDRSGHLPFIEEADRFEQRIRDWLTAIDTTTHNGDTR